MTQTATALPPEALKPGVRVISTEKLIDLDLVRPRKDQPRQFFDEEALRGLARSIRTIGQLTPILVVEVDDDTSVKYEIDDGERRWRACRLANINSIRALVIERVSDNDRFVRSVGANFGREGHTHYETARALGRLREMGHSPQAIADICAHSRPWVYQHLAILALAPAVVELMEAPAKKDEGAIKFPVAQVLAQIEDHGLQTELAREITVKKMSVVAAKHLIRVRTHEQGIYVGGSKQTPNRDYNRLMSLVEHVFEGLPTIIDMPGRSFNDLFAQRSRDELDVLCEQLEFCVDGLQATFEAIKEIRDKKPMST